MGHKKKSYKSVKASQAQNTKSAKRKFSCPRVSAVVLLFLVTWLIVWLMWGDVFYMAEQNSYLAFNSTIMQNVMDLKWGFYILLGRFFLLLFHFPVIGSLLMATFLTGIACLLKYLLPKNNYLQILAVLIPLAYVFYLAYRGLNLFYQHEPGYYFAHPIAVLLVLSIVALFVRLLIKRKRSDNVSHRVNLAQILTIVVAGILLVGYSYYYRENMRVTAKMQRLLEAEAWDEMIDLGLSCKQPDRSVCCYYAIALSQTDQLSNRLFEIKYQYPKPELRNMSGQVDPGTEYFNYDGDYYAGLVNSAYHDCMERAVMDGPTVVKLKRMFLCSLINGEYNLAEKYMHLIKCVPFEGDFAEKYEAMITNHELITKDPALVKVAECVPLEDDYEQRYNVPLFLGYNVELTSGRHIRALYHSLAACLYAKNLDHYFDRLGPIADKSLPRPFEDALIIQSLKKEVNLKDYKIAPLSISSLKQFMTTVAPYRNADKKAVAKQFRENYYGYYPLYYYFENIPDENYLQNQQEKGQVN